jgi:hypothetical protein
MLRALPLQLAVLAALSDGGRAYRFLALGDFGASFETPKDTGAPRAPDACATSAAACAAHGDKSCGYDPEQLALGQQQPPAVFRHVQFFMHPCIS